MSAVPAAGAEGMVGKAPVRRAQEEPFRSASGAGRGPQGRAGGVGHGPPVAEERAPPLRGGRKGSHPPPGTAAGGASPRPLEPRGTRGPLYAWERWGLGLALLAALALRLLDPLSTRVIGAEDPYLHMERTWNLLQHGRVEDYPAGFMVLLAPFAMLGPETLYAVARFLPPLVGVAGVAALWWLARVHVGPWGALAAAILSASMPELILRTNLLFPTALDLALLPLLFMGCLAAARGSWLGLIPAGGILLLLGAVHPWAVGVVLPVILVWAVVLLARHPARPAWAAPAVAGSLIVLPLVLWLLPFADPDELLLRRAFPRLGELILHPSTFTPLPDYVNLPAMLTWTVLVLAPVGAGIALLRRSPLDLLAVLWTGLLLPIALVDWFDIWYLPHRVVAFLALGAVLLAALAVETLVRVVAARRPSAASARGRHRNPAARSRSRFALPSAARSRLPRIVGISVLVILFALTLPAGAQAPRWYRLHDGGDYEAWASIESWDPSLTVASSWQSRSGYRALTGEPAVFDPTFFNDPHSRGSRLAQHPDLVVLVDHRTGENGLETGFLSGWRLLGEWGDTRAYVQE